jgi:hypothetical protein
MKRILGGKASNQQEMKESNLGFHGDQYLLNILDPLLDDADIFIETGANVGQTLRYVVDRYPDLELYSCEPNTESLSQAADALGDISRVHLYNMVSQDFLPKIVPEIEHPPVCWIDAHGDGFKWPLRYEIEYLTHQFEKGYLVIDDFKVPDEPQFGYDEYDGQVCSMSYIEDYFASEHKYTVIYPSYEVRTSNHHPLRGYVIICINTGVDPIPPQLLENNYTVTSPL